MKMSFVARVAVAMVVGVTTLAIPHVAAAQQTPPVIAKLDAASKNFRNAQADVKWDYYQKAVHDTTTDTGSIYFQRDGGAMDMGAVMNDPTGKTKASKILEFKNGTLKMFTPGTDQMDVIQAGANQGEYESFLTLGSGGSGTDLMKSWIITDLGPETLSDDGKGVMTERLDLIAKDPVTKSKITHVTIWVDPTRAVSLKQIFFTPAGDYRTTTYSHIKVNGNVDKGKYAIKTDKKTQVFNH
jgi:hypothetical protein